jgi:hypothetical protein
LIIYSFAPLVGLSVFLANPESLERCLLGLIGIAIGSLALYLLFARLADPLQAIGYALCPVGVISQLIERWQPERESLHAFLAKGLPDVEIGERCGEGVTVLAVGEELLIYLSPPSLASEELEGLREALRGLRTPLHEEQLLIVLPANASMEVEAGWRESLAEAHLIKLGS